MTKPAVAAIRQTQQAMRLRVLAAKPFAAAAADGPKREERLRVGTLSLDRCPDGTRWWCARQSRRLRRPPA
jgi:hypothetical protein